MGYEESNGTFLLDMIKIIFLLITVATSYYYSYNLIQFSYNSTSTTSYSSQLLYDSSYLQTSNCLLHNESSNYNHQNMTEYVNAIDYPTTQDTSLLISSLTTVDLPSYSIQRILISTTIGFLDVFAHVLIQMIINYGEQFLIATFVMTSVLFLFHLWNIWIDKKLRQAFSFEKPTHRKSHRKKCARFYGRSSKGRHRIGNKREKRRLTFHHEDHHNFAYMAEGDQEVSKLKIHSLPFSHQYSFDTDSYEIIVDNGASKCVSNNPAHFISPIIPSTKYRKLKGIDGSLNINGTGTVAWIVHDDYGKRHKFIIHDCLYVPTMARCLLSPQHWARGNNHQNKLNKFRSITEDQATVLKWDQHTLTIPHHPLLNIAILHAGLSIKSFRKATAIAEANHMKLHPQTPECSLLSTGMLSPPIAYEGIPSPQDFLTPSNNHTTFSSSSNSQQPTTIPFHDNEIDNEIDDSSFHSSNQNGISTDIEDDEENKEEQSDESSANSTKPFDFEDKQDLILEQIDEVQNQHFDNMTPSNQLLYWHLRLGHLSFTKVKLLAILGILPKSLINVRIPKCAGCLLGAMTKKPWRVKGEKNKKILKTAKKPGDIVSVDQLESSTPGFIGQLKGILTKSKYKAATVFIDHYSDLTYIHLNQSLTGHETVEAKKAFEAYAQNRGIRIQHYHCDNGRFADNEFVKSVEENGQTISYCGAYAHFQNGKAEKRIRDIQEHARKMLIHANSKWSSANDLQLWPFALQHATVIRNSLPDKEDGSSPQSRFDQVNNTTKLKHIHSFGCPIYALNNKLQNGQKIPKWDARCRIGLYLGKSPRHSSNVSMVLNLSNGLVSPQFHVQHDDLFETVRGKLTTDQIEANSSWKKKAGINGIFIIAENYSKSNPSICLHHSTDTNQSASEGGESSNINQNNSPNLHDQEENDTELPISSNEDNISVSEGDESNTISPPINSDLATSRRSGQMITPSFRQQQSVGLTDRVYSAYYDALHEDDYELQDKMEDPISFLSELDDKNHDTLYYHDAMKQSDADQFKDAMKKEFVDHCKRDHWDLIPMSEVPKDHRVLDSVWAMKRKRDIKTRKVYKWKARLNIHGGQQEIGENFYETYAPVVNWFTVRIIMLLAILNKWHTRRVDFVLAFPQAEIEDGVELYMKLPLGIASNRERKDYALKIKRNIYGQKQAARIWNVHLRKGLESIGFEQSTVDECLYFRGKTIFMFYVDDGIIISPDDKDIDRTIKQLQDEKFDVEDMGQIGDYLGINFNYLENGDIKLSQPHLINRFENKEDHDEERFKYKSIVGKLNFLDKGSRPDISYASHQCARHSISPKKSHGDAIIHICQYLKGTKNEGLILKPDKSKSLRVYVDADFSGNYNKLTCMEDPSTSKSRTGYTIMYCGCPIIWTSKLQTQVALSTTEAEYIGLSQSLRDTIPIINLLNEMKERGIDIYSTTPSVYCTAFEDNNGALELARVPKMRARTKHINLVYHHFRSFVKKRIINIYPIDTKDQLADIFTKPLDIKTFIHLRKRLLGW